MPQHPVSIWHGTLDTMDLSDVLDLVTNGHKGWRLLWNPFPGIPWGNLGQSFAPHGLQRGDGCLDPELGYSGGTNGGGIRRTQRDYPGVGGVFLCR